MKFKKSLGQNLLIDKNILKKIISITSLYNKEIIEIGPGTGNLTKEILKAKPKKIICIEKDRNFADELKNTFFKEKTLTVINTDILRLNLKKLISKDTIVIGNLPYNISTQILLKFIRFDPWLPKFKKIIFMFQKEVGEKIIASSGSSDFSRLSIITKSRFKILKFFYVSKNCFIPKPKIESIVIELQPILNKNASFKSIKTLEYITNIFFSNRRKMINKAFKKLGINDADFFKKNKINLSLRAENLSENQFYNIAEYYEKIK